MKSTHSPDVLSLVIRFATADTGLPFHHREHVATAWAYLRLLGPSQGADRFADDLRAFAAASGVPDKYHETITRFWLAVVRALMLQDDDHDLHAWLDRYRHVLTPDALSVAYSPAVLATGRARRHWMEPDRVSVETLAIGAAERSPAAANGGVTQ